MKKIPLLLLTNCLSVLIAAGLPGQYEAVMLVAIEKLYQANSMEAFREAANTFERIAQKETDKWHPRYYGAYAQIMMSTQTEIVAQKDQLLDEALELVGAAKTLEPKISELMVLEGFIHMLRIPIDPAGRGAQYSGKSTAALQQAVSLNPKNPRAHLLLAEMQYGTAQFFGSDTHEACGTLEQAIRLFDTFKPGNSLDPNWGKEWATQSKQRCE